MPKIRSFISSGGFFRLLEETLVSLDTRVPDLHTHDPEAEQAQPPQPRDTALLLHLLQRKCRSLYQHSLRVRHLSLLIANHLHLSPQDRVFLATGALLHDIGKIALPDELLQKSERLTPEEFEYVKQHSFFGAHLLSWVKMPDPIIPLVYHHHESWDGTGYPEGLAGEAIPLGARIIALADAFDVITSTRPYQQPRSLAEALAEVQRCSGGQFDPFLVEHFCQMWGNAEKMPG